MGGEVKNEMLKSKIVETLKSMMLIATLIPWFFVCMFFVLLGNIVKFFIKDEGEMLVNFAAMSVSVVFYIGISGLLYYSFIYLFGN